ncbi:hypothetical protein DXG01_006360 [Tephrocybe rancida]|nr:hypothetical protein DXG01_006360 [Tephrocybe rancida]
MLATTLLTLALAAFASAAPNESEKHKRASCDISHATIKYPAAQTTLATPAAPLSYVAVAIGVQNYTCSAAGTYTNVGAVAELFDIGCFYGTPAFDQVTDFAYSLWNLAPPTLTPQGVITLLQPAKTPAVLGQHYYVTNPITGTGVNPKWDFTSQGATKGNSKAYVVAAKVVGMAAPTGSQDIDWVQLKSLTGSLATDVYRTDTRAGQPPASCQSKSHDAHFTQDTLLSQSGPSLVSGLRSEYFNLPRSALAGPGCKTPNDVPEVRLYVLSSPKILHGGGHGHAALEYIVEIGWAILGCSWVALGNICDPISESPFPSVHFVARGLFAMKLDSDYS